MEIHDEKNDWQEDGELGSQSSDAPGYRVDWKNSPEVLRDRTGEPMLDAEACAELLRESASRW
jgi:hypothetical protein